MADPRVPNQSELLAQLGMMVGLLERNTVTIPDTLKKIATGLRMMPMAEIHDGRRHTFAAMSKELKCIVLEHLETTELLIVAQVSKDWTAIVVKIVEERQRKRNEWVKLGRKVWGEDVPVEQVEILLGSLSNLKLGVRLSLGEADVQSLVKKVGLKLLVEAVLGVQKADVEMQSGDHLMELLASMGGSNMQLESLTLHIPNLSLNQLPEGLLLNLGKLTCVTIMPIDSDSGDFDFTKVLLALAENPFNKLENVSLYGGSIRCYSDFAKISKAIASLKRFSLLTEDWYNEEFNFMALKRIPGVSVFQRNFMRVAHKN